MDKNRLINLILKNSKGVKRENSIAISKAIDEFCKDFLSKKADEAKQELEEYIITSVSTKDIKLINIKTAYRIIDNFLENGKMATKEQRKKIESVRITPIKAKKAIQKTQKTLKEYGCSFKEYMKDLGRRTDIDLGEKVYIKTNNIKEECIVVGWNNSSNYNLYFYSKDDIYNVHPNEVFKEDE